jgi:hypothetical protein
MAYRSKAQHYYKPNAKFERTRKFWQIYRGIKWVIGIIYDSCSVILILMSFDKVYKFKSWRVIKPWQIANLVEKVPKLFRSLRHKMTYGI